MNVCEWACWVAEVCRDSHEGVGQQGVGDVAKVGCLTIANVGPTTLAVTITIARSIAARLVAAHTHSFHSQLFDCFGQREKSHHLIYLQYLPVLSYLADTGRQILEDKS